VQVKPKEHSSYTSGGLVTSSVTVVSAITVSNVQLAVLDSDSGIPDFSAVLDFEKQEKTLLSANHLQKLRLSFELTSPSGSSFKPQQVFLYLENFGFSFKSLQLYQFFMVYHCLSI
jgi:oligosaccharyltransferase complex subunit delta (ribophorin II)